MTVLEKGKSVSFGRRFVERFSSDGSSAAGWCSVLRGSWMVTSRRPIRAMMCDQLSAGLFIRQAAPSHDLQTPKIDDLLHPVRARVSSSSLVFS